MQTMKNRVFELKANMGFVVRGPLESLKSLDDRLERFCRELGLKIAYKTASASRLWIQEDGKDDDRRTTNE